MYGLEIKHKDFNGLVIKILRDLQDDQLSFL